MDSRQDRYRICLGSWHPKVFATTPRLTVLAAVLTNVAAHGHDDIYSLPINTALGVPGFPDCVRAHPELSLGVDAAAMDLVCRQRGSPGAIKVGCVGDSITAGVHSSGGIHPFPAQLQIMLDQAHGKGTYAVTNLGACGSMMLKNSSSCVSILRRVAPVCGRV